MDEEIRRRETEFRESSRLAVIREREEASEDKAKAIAAVRKKVCCHYFSSHNATVAITPTECPGTSGSHGRIATRKRGVVEVT